MSSNNSKFKVIKHYLSYIDLFGQKIEFTYNQGIYFKTYYGAIFSMIIFTFLIFQVIIGYKDLTTRSNPIINMMEVEDEEIRKIDLVGDNVTIAIRLIEENKSDYTYDSSFFEIEIRHIASIKNESNDVSSSQYLELENCANENFEYLSNFYKSFHLNKALCLKTSNIDKLEIYSDPQQFVENYLKIILKICTDSENKKCKSEVEIFQKLIDLNLYLYIVHDYFDGRDHDNPIKRRLTMEKWSFNELQTRRKDSLFLSSGNLIDYNNFIMTLSEPKPEKLILLSEKDTVRNFKFVDIRQDKKLLDIYVKAHAIPVKIIRKFNTILDLLASIGGLFNIFFVAGNFVFGFINRTSLGVQMINDNFNIVDNRSFEMKPITDKSHLFNRNSTTNIDIGASTIVKDDNNKDELLMKTKQFDSSYTLSYSMKDILLSLCLCQRIKLKKKNKIYEQCQNIINSYLDIRKLISMIQEFKVIRHILFDSIQLSLIDYYKKPVFKIDDKIDNQIYTIYRKSHLDDNLYNEKEMDLEKYLETLKERMGAKSDKIDQKLFEFGKKEMDY